MAYRVAAVYHSAVGDLIDHDLDHDWLRRKGISGHVPWLLGSSTRTPTTSTPIYDSRRSSCLHIAAAAVDGEFPGAGGGRPDCPPNPA